MSAPGTLATAPPAPPAAPRVHRVHRVHRTELLRGFGAWTGAAVAGGVLVTVLARRYSLGDDWAVLHGALREAGLLLGGPLALAAGCWQGGRERRRGTGDLLASAARPPLRRALVAALPSMAWPVLGYLAAVGVCLALVLPYASHGHPAWDRPAADAVALGALGALGFAAGRALPWRFAAPLLAVAGYLLLGIGAYGESGATVLSPAYAGPSGDAPVWWAAPLAAVWFAGTAAAALLAGHARRRVLAVLPLVVAVAAASVLYRSGADLWRPDPAASALVCDRGTPTVCVRAAHGSALPAVRAVVDRVDARLDGAPGAPVRYREGGSSETAPPGEVRFQLYGGVFRGRLGDDGMLYRDLVYAVSSSAACEGDRAGDRAYANEYAAQEWLRLGRPLFPAGQAENRLARAAAQRLRAMTAADRRAWFGRYLAGVRACDVGGVPAP
ncbi:hypothetical protein PV341_23025 [Streptomyces sp. PA03-1a]|nr:hypothetical protein [Streptomyces sp. PA03-1a]MDX2814346.1 hypothetical protein [Streptomyces sp. PA03-5A]